jgi:hypothetical protein
MVLAFDEERLNQVFRQRTIGATAIVPVKLKQFGVVQSWLSKKGLGFMTSFN